MAENKSIRFLFLALLAISLVFLVSCGNNQTTQQKGFAGGTTGLEFDFMVGQPPDQVYTGTPFNVMIQINNKGESPANGYVLLEGLPPNILGNSQKDFSNLEGTKVIGTSIIPGQTTSLIWDNLQISSIGASTDLPLQATICYNYATKAASQLCVSPDQYDTETSKPCLVNTEKVVQNSGAPVHITSLSEAPGGTTDNNQRYMITFTITNVGKGKVFSKEVDKCNWAIQSSMDWNKVHVKVELPQQGPQQGREKIKCMGSSNYNKIWEGDVILTGEQGKEEATVTCEMITPKGDVTYSIPLNIELTYKYSEKIQKTISVIEMNR